MHVLDIAPVPVIQISKYTYYLDNMTDAEKICLQDDLKRAQLAYSYWVVAPDRLPKHPNAKG